MLLAEAAVAAEAGEHAQALRLLLQAWPSLPAAALAERVERLGALVDTSRPRLSGKSAEAKKAWLAAARERDVADGQRLLEALSDVLAKEAAARLDVLERWPDDPRVDMALANALVAMPYRATSSQPFWRRLLSRLARALDPRVLGVAAQVPALYRRTFKTINGAWLSERVQRWQAEHGDRLRANAQLGVRAIVDSLQRIDRCCAAATVSTPRFDAEVLYERVFADPESDEPRRILGDVLSERGDPRGELIALQYAKIEGTASAEQRRREKALIAEHRAQLLGPLATVVQRKGEAFARGFLSRCSVRDANPAHIEAVLGHPMWATVEHISGPQAIYDHPVMRSLVSLDKHYTDPMKRICTRERPWRLRRLAAFLHQRADARALSQAPALPELRELCLSASEDRYYDPLLGGSLFGQLERLRVYGEPKELGKWVARVQRRGALQQFELVWRRAERWRNEYRLTRDEAGQLSRIEVEVDAPRDDGRWAKELIATTVSALQSLPAKFPRQLTVRSRHRRHHRDGQLYRPIHLAARRFKSLEQLELP